MLVREPTREDRRIWRRARWRWSLGTVQRVFGFTSMEVALDDVPSALEERVDRPAAAAGSFRGVCLGGALAGEVAERLLVEGSMLRRPRGTAMPGRVSLPADGLLWQPDRDDDRGFLARTGAIEVLVVGLPRRGVLVHLRDGRLGMALFRSDHRAFLVALAERFGPLP